MSTPQEYAYIATTILSQIGVRNVMCLGIPQNSKAYLTENEQRRGGVRFKFTNCFKIRNGTVEIDLNWIDTYTVRIYNQLGNLKSEVSGIYNDQLADHLMEIIGY